MKLTTIFFLILACASLYSATAQDLLPGEGQDGMWMPNGAVYTLANDGDVVYAGGYFSHVTRFSGNGAIYDVNANEFRTTASADKAITRVLTDHHGGFFINGQSLSIVGKQPVKKVAHILADGSVSPSFALPFVGSYLTIHLVASTADRLYIFTRDGDPNRFRLHCLDHNGNLIWTRSANHRIINGVVDNGILYVAGQFTSFEGLARNRVAALNANTGELLAFDCNVNIPLWAAPGFIAEVPSNLINIGVSGNEVYVGYRASDYLQSRIIALDKTTGQASPWSQSFMAGASGLPMLIHNGILYQASSDMPKVVMVNCAAKQPLNTPTALNNWNREIAAMTVSNDRVIFAAASFNPTADQVVSLNPADNSLVALPLSTPNDVTNPQGTRWAISTMAVSNGNLYCGGSFHGVESYPRSNLYAFNKVTHELLPPPSTAFELAYDDYSFVENVAVVGSRLYLQGGFTSADGSTEDRNMIAVNRATGEIIDWAEPANLYNVTYFAKEEGGSHIYIPTSATPPSTNLLRIDGHTGETDQTWTFVSTITTITRMAANATYLVVTGRNANLNRNEIHIADAASGQALFPPIVYTGNIAAIDILNNMVYVGGNIATLTANGATVARSKLAAIDVGTGSITDFHVQFPNGAINASMINAIDAVEGTLYIAGRNFGRINGIARQATAAISLETNQVTNWQVGIQGVEQAYVIKDFGDGIYIGGWFTRIFLDNPKTEYRHVCIGKFSRDRSNRISGRVFYDNNQNGVQDAGENGIPNLLMELQPGNIFYPTNATGDFTAYSANGDFTIRPTQPNYTLAVSPPSRNISFNDVNLVSSGNNFGITIQQNTTDMRVALVPSRNPSPGFYMDYTATITNEGTVASSGAVIIELDNRLLFQSSSVAPEATSENTFTFAYANILPGNAQSYILHMRVPPPTAQGSLLGQVIQSTATVTPALNDVNSSDNVVDFEQTVIGSFDPNDKLVTPAGDTPNGYIAENTQFLEYTIRFQNMGTAPAEFVTITDQLDQDLDISSFTFIAASHPNTFEIVNGTLSVTFNNIQLPTDDVDEPGSHGFFTYRIDLQDNLPRGTVIENTANIVFDYNLPIATNTTVNTLLDPPYFTTVFMLDTTAQRSTEILYPVLARDFSGVLGQQFSIAWDEQVVAFGGIQQFGLPGLTLNQFNIDHADEGYITMAWTDPSSTPQSLPDSSVLFLIRFTLSGNYGASTPVTISNSPTPIEAINSNYETFAVETINGSISISTDVVIQGTVAYPNDEGVQQVAVMVTGSQQVQAATNANGQYSATVQPVNANALYTITPTKTNDPNLLNGIDVQDVALIRRHILRTELFTTPFQFIAADVSNNYNISIQDLAIIQALILGVETDFPNGRQWAFIDDAYSFNSPTSPFPYPQSVTLPVTTLEQGGPVNFTAVKMGDINLTRDNTQNGRTQTQEVVLELSPLRETGDGLMEADVKVFGFIDISAYQFTFDWNADLLQWHHLEDKTVTQVNALQYVDHGFMTALWDEPNGASITLEDGATLFTVQFLKQEDVTNTLLHITGNRTPLKMFGGQLQPVNVTVRYGASDKKLESGVFYPNPFQSETKISFTATENQQASFEVVDVSGKIIRAEEVNVAKGFNEKTVNGEQLKPGVYIFKMQMRDKVIKGKMVKRGN